MAVESKQDATRSTTVAAYALGHEPGSGVGHRA